MDATFGAGGGRSGAQGKDATARRRGPGRGRWLPWNGLPWLAPDGSAVNALLLSDGYFNAACLPADLDAAATTLAGAPTQSFLADTMAELGLADFEVGTWSGIIAPKGVPATVATCAASRCVWAAGRRSCRASRRP